MANFFCLVVDDGGFHRMRPDGDGMQVDFSAYTNIARLARHFDVQIILACTTKFLDVHLVSESPRPHEDTPRIIALLEAHRDRIIVADHGYDHRWGNSYLEFYDYKHRYGRPADEQERHIDQSMMVYENLGWPVPKLFVAPSHGWEPGVTDRLYAERGVRYLTSYVWIKNVITGPLDILRLGPKRLFEPQMKYPQNSPYLEVLPRLGLNIPSSSTQVSAFEWLRAYHSVVPTGSVRSMLLHRRMVSQPHNYAAHIANFAGDANYRRWCNFLEQVAANKARLAKTFDESLELWRHHKYDGEEVGRSDG